ncbi:MAG: HAD family hydrolase [Clostridia bacterium]|nr:HAD family hydrolase [Clostridia bacterium]
MKKAVFFDLDGTLTDPALGITNSILYALEKMGLGQPPREELYCFIGPPLLSAFQEYFGMTKEQAEEAIVRYREYFSVKGLLENAPYKGVDTMLAALKDAGYALFVATSKPEQFAVQILEHFGLAQYFDRICGASMDASRNTKTAVLEYLLSETGAVSASAADGAGDSAITVIAMVGDRHHDIEGAKNVGIPSVGVLWGYGSAEELQAAGADYTASSMEHLVEILCSL